MMRVRSGLAVGLSALLVCGGVVPAWAEIALPPGFSSRVYVSGEGFDRVAASDLRGIPVTTTLAIDPAGRLYLARSGNRYGAGQFDEILSRLYRIPPGGAWMTPATEARYFHGPPLRNPEVGGVGLQGEVYVTTYEPDRGIGVLYRMKDGRPELFAGGTPPVGRSPLLEQPEAVAVGRSGAVYVADRARGLVVKLDPTGRLLDPRLLSVPHARMLAIDGTEHLWAAGDGTAARPWQEGTGEIWRVGPTGGARLVLEGPHAAAIAVGPEGALFVALRHDSRVVVLTPDGRQTEFVRFTGETAPRSLAFAPDTPETRRAGIAGDLFVVTLAPRTWYINEVVRISGPFAAFVRGERPTSAP